MEEHFGQMRQTLGNTQKPSAFMTQTEVTYYRKASGSQYCPDRNEQQKKVYDEFFFVKNHETSDKALYDKYKAYESKRKLYSTLSKIMWLPFLLGLILTIISQVTDWVGAKALWIVLLVLGAIMIIGCIVMSTRAKRLAGQYFGEYLRSKKSTPEKLMSIDEYFAQIDLKINSMELDKVGVKMFDFTESQEFTNEPMIFKTQILRDYSYYLKINGDYYSSTEQLSMWFFTEKELYLYKINFDMTCNVQEEETHEFFYNEIDDISTKVYKNYITLGNDKIETCTITFEITVQGQVLKFEFDANDKKVLELLKLRQLIRERKSNF